jgi:aromatic ring-opening dioxygenase catalytic subunit (LigB family)
MNRMPVYFLSHGGGPWPVVDGMKQSFARTERDFRALPERLPARPRAVLVVTGHWEESEFTVSTSERPPMVYDYSGFPPHTYHIHYPAPGSPALAARVKHLIGAAGMPVSEDPQRGFDHGTFVPLMLMYPAADVPVVMLSLKSNYDPEAHVRAGQALAPLRDEGVLILGSGMTYHNMRGMGRDDAIPVAEAFEGYLSSAIEQTDWKERNDRLIRWQEAPGARLAHPREDHLIPLMSVAGAAAEDSGRILSTDYCFKVPVASYEFSARP